jgi:hypothetical protein
MSFLADARIVSRALNRFYRQSMARKGRVVSQALLEDLIAGLGLSDLARQGGLTGGRLSRFLNRYLSASTRLHHPA